MATDILLPILGESISEAVVARWLKQEGDPVKMGEPIAELETAKATLDLECPASGVLRRRLVAEGETVVTGQKLALVTRPDETLAEEDQPEAEAQPQAVPQAPALVPAAAPAGEIAPRLGRRVSPAARKRARELGIDIQSVLPARAGERVTSQDVEKDYQTQVSAHLPAHHWVEPTEVRREMARRMSESAQTIPQFSASMDVRMEAFQQALSEVKDSLGPQAPKISVTALLAYLLVPAWREHPLINASFDAPTGRVQVYDTFNLAVGADTPRGLVAPVVHHLEELSLSGIALHLNEVVSRARAGSLALDDLNESTFTLSNLGMWGVSQFVPLVNPPQAAILGVGAIHTDFNGLLLTLTLSADHRVLDGVQAARFLAALKDGCERCRAANIHL